MNSPGFSALYLLLISFVLLVSHPLIAQATPTPRAIVNKANLASFYPGNDGRSDARMTITDSQGRVQRRQFTLLRRNISNSGDQDMMIFFSRPADVRGTVFRVAKHLSTDDDRWIYLPGLDLVKRISAGDKRTSFVGSHFFYEDVSGRNPDLDNFSLVEQTEAHWLIEATPKQQEGVEFSRYQVWINKASHLPVKVDFYDHGDSLYRRLEVLKVETVDGFPTAMTSRMSDLNSNANTLLEFRFAAYNLGLPKDIFGERSLRTPPRQYLKRPER
ncbi:outer membrane lipoprotein-sorting protein [Motiliproteus sp. MSK22-1]|nr:outer membrane lipoprotein-sorting protein [Motiliproteus sp. MSK22-1]